MVSNQLSLNTFFSAAGHDRLADGKPALSFWTVADSKFKIGSREKSSLDCSPPEQRDFSLILAVHNGVLLKRSAAICSKQRDPFRWEI